MRDFIERLRAKPEHVRRRIAFGTTFGITGLITLVWVSAVVVSGNLALAVPELPGDTGTIAQAPTTDPNAALGAGAGIANVFDQTKTSLTQLLGAVGIATATTAPASLQTVDQAEVAPQNSKVAPQATVIPF